MRKIAICIRVCFLLVISLMLCSEIFAGESTRITPIVKIVKEWSPAVVNISTERVVTLRTNPFWGQFGGMISEFNNQNAQTIGTMNLKSVGSGVIISKKGLILTNAHVVQMASKIYVILSDGKQAEAVMERISPEDDLALIKIEPPEELKQVKLADDAIIGETVVAVGDPLGLENSVSAGIISGLNRDIGSNGGVPNPVFTGLIQTDASINQGNSGGALFNLDGQLVGINIALVQGANSISFAIPYTKIKKVLKEHSEGRAENAPSVVNVIKIPGQ